jgi:hypothetical protein
MELEPGYRLCVAPRFHVPPAWPERIRLSGGVAGWRPATDAEIALLLAEAPPGEDAWQRHVCLFAIPAHLRSRWWEMAARQVEERSAGTPDITEFARAVADFARFKRLPLPPRCSFEVVLTPPGQASTRRGDAAASPPTVAAINLGDERGSVVLINLPPSRLGELRRARGGAVMPGDQTPRSLSSSLAYPLVRLFLEPGEGFSLPAGEIFNDGCTTDKPDIDVWLVMRQALPQPLG